MITIDSGLLALLLVLIAVVVIVAVAVNGGSDA